MRKVEQINLDFARLLVIAGVVESRLKEGVRVSVETYGIGDRSFIQIVTWDAPMAREKFSHEPGIPKEALLDKDRIQRIAKWVLKELKKQCPEYFE